MLILCAFSKACKWYEVSQLSFCTFRFDAIIQRNLRTLLLQLDSPCSDHYVCVIQVHTQKATHAWLAGLATNKSGFTTTHPPYVMAIWLPLWIPPLNFFDIIGGSYAFLLLLGTLWYLAQGIALLSKPLPEVQVLLWWLMQGLIICRYSK